MNSLKIAAVVFLALGQVHGAFALDADSETDALIMRGLDLRRAGKSAEALELFRRAYDGSPSPRTLGQLGLVESSLQLWTDADAHLSAAVATPDNLWVRRNRRFIDQAMDRTKDHVGELAITGPPGTKVSLGGKAIGALPLAAPVRIAEGDFSLTATAAGFRPFSVDVSVKGGGRAAVSIVLEPLDLRAPNPADDRPSLAEPSHNRRRLWAGTTLAAAGLGALVWGIVWIAVDGKRSCDGSQATCPTVYDTRGSGIALAAGGGVLALVAGALLYSSLHTGSSTPLFGMTTRSVQVEARF